MYIVLNGDNLELLKNYPDNHFDAVVTDPPYGLGKEPDAVELMKDWVDHGYHEIKGTGFMGKEWDAFVPQPLFWKEVFRVLKHGGHVLAFYGTRTFDWGVMAMRFAGFEVRDSIYWHYGSGFPKSHNIGKAIGNTKWEGWGSALKPASEPIVLARKPLEKGLSIAENVLKWGTGGINIDGCRVTTNDNLNGGAYSENKKEDGEWGTMHEYVGKDYEQPQGRFPANLIMSHCDYQVMNLVGNLPNGILQEIKEYFYGYTKVFDLRERKRSSTKQDKCRDEVLQSKMQKDCKQKKYNSKKDRSSMSELPNDIYSNDGALSERQEKVLQSKLQRPASKIDEGGESDKIREKTYRGIEEENGGNQDKERNNIIEREASELEGWQNNSSRICEHNDFNTSDGLARNGEENATKSNIHIGASDSDGDGNKKTAIGFGECTSHKWDKKRQQTEQFGDRGHSESLEEASGNRCGDGKIEERKPILEVIDFDVPAQWLRYFKYTGENLGCECKGTKKVGNGKEGGYNYEGNIYDVDGFVSKNSPYANSNYGIETIEDWSCHEDCPIKIMDEQSGISKSPNKVSSGGKTFHGEKYDSRAIDKDCFGDKGGSSRFFYCAKASKSERNKGLENERWFYDLELITDCCSFTEENLFIWEKEVLNQSMDLNGEAQQEKDILGDIVLLAKDKECCTTFYGKKITGLFPKGIKFTTKTGLSQIIELKTLNYYQHLSISDCIVDVLEMNKENGLNLAENVGLKNILKAIFIKDKEGFPLGVKIVAKETQLKTSVKDVWLKRNIHSTVKPVKLMQYLVRLITPPNGLVLDPFCGSGTTGIACKLEGFRFVGMEQDPEYTKIAQARIENWREDKSEIKNEKSEKSEMPVKPTFIQKDLF